MSATAFLILLFCLIPLGLAAHYFVPPVHSRVYWIVTIIGSLLIILVAIGSTHLGVEVPSSLPLAFMALLGAFCFGWGIGIPIRRLLVDKNKSPPCGTNQLS